MYCPKNIANRIIKKYGTRDPFEICDEMGINVMCTDLPNSVNGFFLNALNKNIIYINENLCEEKRKVVCAHELGHVLMHPSCNLLFMREKTFFVTEKFEREADLFSAYLLIDKNKLCYEGEETVTIDDICCLTGIERKIVELYFNNNN